MHASAVESLLLEKYTASSMTKAVGEA